MADTGWKSPTTCGSKHNQWANCDKAYSSNDDYSIGTVTTTGTGVPVEKIQSWETFSFGIGAGDTIDGIEVSYEHFESGDTVDIVSIIAEIFSDSSSSFGLATVGGISVRTSEGIDIVGNSTDLWNKTWDGSDMSNANFSVRIAAKQGGISKTSLFNADHIQVKVYYSVAAGPANVKTINGIVIANAKTVGGIDIGNVKTIDGIT